jgi:FixJ family two-component response regulator
MSCAGRGEEAPREGEPVPPGQPLVIVVEDDADMSRAVESVLNAAGFDTAMFPSAEALLEAQVSADMACLVLDVHLPGMTGFELYDRLTATHPPCPVIFMTAYDEPTARARSVEARAVACLIKPFAGKRLIECVGSVIRAGTRDRGQRKSGADDEQI